MIRSLLPLFLFVLAVPAFGQAYESAFEPLAVGKASGRVYKNPQVSIENGTGFVNFSMPIGPSMGARGISFTPTMRLHVSPKVIPRGLLDWNPALHAYEPPNRHILSCQDPTMKDWIFLPMQTPRWWSAASAFRIPENGYLVSGEPHAGSYQLYWSFNSDESSVRSIDPGFGSWMTQSESPAIILPTGESLAGINLPSNAPPPNPASYSSMLAAFGYSLTDVSRLGARHGSNGYIIVYLKGSNGQEYEWRDGLYYDLSRFQSNLPPLSAPARMLVVKGEVAYEFEKVGTRSSPYYRTTYSEIDGSAQFTEAGSAVDSLGYTIRRIKNRFGDSIEFTNRDDMGYSAEMHLNGQASGRRVDVFFSEIAGATATIPSLGGNLGERGCLVTGQHLKITVEHKDSEAILSKFILEGGNSGGVSQNLPLEWPLPPEATHHYYENRRVFQPISIKEVETGHQIDFAYTFLEASVPHKFPNQVGGSVPVKTGGLQSIRYSGGEEFRFEYEPKQYFHDVFGGTGSSSLLGVQSVTGLSWPVSSVWHGGQDGVGPRVTRYTRRLPTAQDHVNPPVISPDFWEAETRPDGSTIVRKFVLPSPVSTGATSETIESRLKAYLFLKNTLFETRTYAPGVNWQSEVGNNSSTAAYEVEYLDRWDMRQLGSPDGTFDWGGTPVPTRQLSWNKLTGVSTLTQLQGWDLPSQSWKETVTSVHRTADPYTAFGLAQGSISPQYQGTAMGSPAAYPGLVVARKTVKEYLPLDGHYNPGLWTKAESFQSGADATGYYSGDLIGSPGSAGYSRTSPAIDREVEVSDGTVKSVKRSGGISWIKEEMKYLNQRGLPSSIEVSGSADLALNVGKVGIQQYGYDTNLQLASIQRAGADYSVSRVMNAMGKPKSITLPDGITIQYEWDSLGRMKGLLPPPLEIPTRLDYPDFKTVTVNRGDEQTSHSLNVFGEVVREVRRGIANAFSHRKFGYDSMGRKTWETTWKAGLGTDEGWEQPYGPGSEFIPATDGRVETFSTIVCIREEPNLDPGSGPESTCVEWGTITSSIHHPGSPAQLVTVGLGNVQQIYDEYGRPKISISPNGEVTQIEYQGLSKSITSGLIWAGGAPADPPSLMSKRITRVIGDELGRTVKIIDAKGEPTLYFFDEQDRLRNVQQQDSKNAGVRTQVRTWKYHELGWLKELTQPESGTTTYSNFDVNGKPWITNYNGRIVNSHFSPLGQVERLFSNDGSIDQEFKYGEGGQVARASGKLTTAIANGVVRSLAYNGQGGLNGRLTTLTRTLAGITPFVQNFTYDNYGRMNTRSYPDGKVQAIGYEDSTNLPKYTDFNSARLTNMYYDPTSWNLLTLAYAGTLGASSEFTYGADQARLATMKHTIQGVTTTWGYQYDSAGRLTTDGKDTFVYDALDRLIGAFVRDPFDKATGFANRGLTQQFAYDAFGNRTRANTQTLKTWGAAVAPTWTIDANGWVVPSATLGGDSLLRTGLDKVTTNVTFNPTHAALLKNQMPAQTSTNGATGAVYDVQGNLIQVYPRVGASTESIIMSYDALGRVSSVTSGLSAARITETYLHDDEGLRIRVWDGTKYRYNIYNEARQLIAQYEKTGTAAPVWKKDIVYLGTKELAEVSSDGKTLVTLCDHLGSPRFTWNGTVKSEQKFLPFGEQLTDPTSMGKFAKGFTNHEQTDASGLIYMQARFYLPMWGRFASPDPGKDQHFEETQSWNIYSYVRNQPTTMVDPDGQNAKAFFDYQNRTVRYAVPCLVMGDRVSQAQLQAASKSMQASLDRTWNNGGKGWSVQDKSGAAWKVTFEAKVTTDNKELAGWRQEKGIGTEMASNNVTLKPDGRFGQVNANGGTEMSLGIQNLIAFPHEFGHSAGHPDAYDPNKADRSLISPLWGGNEMGVKSGTGKIDERNVSFLLQWSLANANGRDSVVINKDNAPKDQTIREWEKK
ncbi:MAG: RHS repeat-associated core domain-containing protein [Rectinemataceae bacterium]|nr:RHS repeat-associated core domain-containing protein [Rectinemataceae bacterium]